MKTNQGSAGNHTGRRHTSGVNGPDPNYSPKAFSPEPSQTKAGVVLAFDNCLHSERWGSTA